MDGRKKDRSGLIQLSKDRESEISLLPDNYQDYFPCRHEEVGIEDWIENYSRNNGIITIDVRSEAEFEEDHLPGAINFPILNNSERDEVGFLYKQVSPKAALYLALKFADDKADRIAAFCEDHNSKEVFVYCWRGGGRSSAVCHYFSERAISCRKILGGYKSYRGKIFDLFYKDPSSLNFVVLSGLTGCGKTEIIEHLTGKVPVFDIEKAAGHASSLFGHIRFEVKTDDIPQNQLQFENRLFEQIIASPDTLLPFITESESKRISRFNIPDELYKKLLGSPVIEITSPMVKRIERIRAEYFSEGIERAYSTVQRSEFLRSVLGKEKISELLELLSKDRIDEFCEWFLKDYYDKRYATKFTKNIANIENIKIDTAMGEIINIIAKLN
jgi:tRNA 2-selenouridine synthase